VITPKERNMGERDAEDRYQVTYKGGLAEGPKARLAPIKLILGADAFVLDPTTAAIRFWERLTIPYSSVSAVTIVPRHPGAIEGFLGGLDGHQADHDNNIQIEYVDAADTVVKLRLEMLTGITVTGQAKRCTEFEHRLRTLGIAARFRPASPGSPSTVDIPAQIAKLSALRDQGILTEAEFTAKKTELLGRL
jgi:hypothetical protein